MHREDRGVKNGMCREDDESKCGPEKETIRLSQKNERPNSGEKKENQQKTAPDSGFSCDIKEKIMGVDRRSIVGIWLNEEWEVTDPNPEPRMSRNGIAGGTPHRYAALIGTFIQ